MNIEHAAMYVRDLDGARDFFIKYFGAAANEGYHNKKTDFRSYFLTFDDGCRLEVMNKPGVGTADPAVERMGLVHLALSVGTKENVDALTDRLRQDGYEVRSGPRVTGDGYYESCVVAFERNLIEITV